VKRKRKRPDEAALRRMGEAWRPWRSVAARVLWHYYAVKAKEAKTSAAAKARGKARGKPAPKRRGKTKKANKGTA
jgi:hypothetical protein